MGDETSMQLSKIRITNFRSINDSGYIDVTRITALLGRNESGKSNLLRALRTLNPADGFEALNPIKDFPRHRKLDECDDQTPVVSTVWTLDESEKKELTDIWPRAAGITNIRIGRRYGAETLWVGIDVPPHAFDIEEIKKAAKKVSVGVKAKAGPLDAQEKSTLEAAASKFAADIVAEKVAARWSQSADGVCEKLRIAIEAAEVELTEKQEELLTGIEGAAGEIAADSEAAQAAKEWAIEQLPVFLYLDEYPEISGHQHITNYLQRRSQGNANDADRNFEKLCKVAGLDPDQLHQLSASDDQETRAQLANRAGSVVTAAIRERWKDRSLKVRFNLDAHHFDTLISDPNAIYDVEVNLNERSRGFQWFFAFYVVFAADTDGGDADHAVLLLDEPGLYLHAKSQGDLLSHLENDFENQILYTTHSPFMVPTHNLDSIRTVNITEEAGTTVSNDPTGDARTLFPLQAALGYDLAQSLFVGPNNLVVEGITDFWILSAVSEHLADLGRTALRPELTITPAGGAPKVHYMVSLLTSESLNVLVLLDDEKSAKATRDDLVKGKLIRSDYVLFVSDAFAGQAPPEADIEDVLDPAHYEALVREAYSSELKGKSLELNDRIPRIAKRVEKAFADLGIPFHKTRPTRLFLAKMADDPSTVLSDQAVERFERLMSGLNEALEKNIKRGVGAGIG